MTGFRTEKVTGIFNLLSFSTRRPNVIENTENQNLSLVKRFSSSRPRYVVPLAMTSRDGR